MTIFKTANKKGKYHDDEARYDILRYILQEHKLPHRCFMGYNFPGLMIEDPTRAAAYYAACMDTTAAKFNKSNGVKVRQFIVSFASQELEDYRIANEIAHKLSAFYRMEYETVYAVHEDTGNLNIHIVINSVSYVDGHRYGGTRKEHHAFLNYAKAVLRPYGINLWYQSNKETA